MDNTQALKGAFRGLLSTLPKISTGTYESIVGDQDAMCEDERQEFETNVKKIASEKIWATCNLLKKWIEDSNETDSNVNIWEEIAHDVDCSNPCHAILAMVHVLLSSKASTSEEEVSSSHQQAAAVSLYLILQRCPGARSRGLTNAITFQYTLKVMNQFTTDSDNMEPMSEAEKKVMMPADVKTKEGDAEDSSSRRNPKRDISNTGSSRAPISLEGCIAQVMKEVDASLKFLPLVVNENTENLGYVVEAVVAALGCIKLPTLSLCATETLCSIALLSYEQAEALVFKGLMPLILGEKTVGGSYIASSAKSVRAAGMRVVNKLLVVLKDNTPATAALAANFLVLIQHLCHKAPEKAEMRGAVVEAVDVILRQLPSQQRGHFTGFISRFSRSSKVNHRIFAVDLVAELLKGGWIWNLSQTCEKETVTATPGGSTALNAATPTRLLNVVLMRASDKAPTVRARSLGAVAALAGAASNHEDGIATHLMHAFLHQSATITPLSLSPNGEQVNEKPVDVAVLLRRRLSDERAMVRRSAVQAAVSFILLNLSIRDAVTSTESNDESAAMMWRDEIDILVSLCGDVSVATRKAAATGLASLRVLLPRSASLRKAFIGAILPLAHDAEQSVQTRCGDLVKEAILEPVAEWGKQIFEEEKSDETRVQDWTGPALDPTGVWYLLLSARSSDSQLCLQSVLWPLHLRAPNVSFTSPSNFVGGANLLSSLLSILRQSALLGSGSNTSEEEGSQPWNGEQLDDDYELKRSRRMVIRQGSWILLEGLLCPNIQGVSASMSQQNANNSSSGMVEASFAVSCWRSLWAEIESTQNILDYEGDGQRILRVLTHLAPSVPAQEASSLAAELLALLQNFEVTASTANDMLRALMSLCTAKAPTPEAAASMCATCATSLLDNAQIILKKFVFPDEEPPELGTVERALFSVGEVGLLCFSPDDNGLASDGRQVLNVEISAEIVSLIRVLLGSTLPEPEDSYQRVEGNAVPDSVRAFAFVALGKVCLVDRGMAKECITLLVREIDESSEDTSSPAVRSNALLVLGDLCVRYTSMVERHMPALAKCLQSKHALMRRHALLLLSQLLLQDFLKWRGLMLHRFLLCCVDDDPEVCQLAVYLITGPLTQKQANLLKHAPLELLFILNNHVDHPIYQKALRQGGDGCNATAVDFSGVDVLSLTKRARLLRFVCGALNDEQRIHITGLVSQEVLGASEMNFSAVDGTSFKVLRDSLMMLSSPEIKVASNGAGEGVTEEEMITAAANGHAASVAAHGMESAKRKLLSNFSKKQLMEHVVPIVLDLKANLEQMRSPLLKDLMGYLTDLLKTYRSEAKAVLSVTDPVLAKELEYDLKNYEKSIKQQKQMLQSVNKNTHSPKNNSASVSFSSPKGKSSSQLAGEANSIVKSIKRPGSAGGGSMRKNFPTPKLRGNAQTPRSDRQGRTPLAAISSVLGKTSTPSSGAEELQRSDRSQLGVDYVISSSGLRNLHVERPNPPTPLDPIVASVHLETTPQHVWNVSVKDNKINKNVSPSFSDDSMQSESPSSSDIDRENISNKKKYNKTASESPNSLPSASTLKKKKTSHKSKGSLKEQSVLAGDSLAAMRPPTHRTPNETRKKKRINS